MNVNYVLRSIRQSRKLLPISIYGSDITPCIPANKQISDEIIPALKLILTAFKTAGFTAYVSKWGELGMYSASLGIEVLVQVSPNLSYMSKANTSIIENVGYEVVDIEIPRKPFLLSYFFLGTASKWRHIPFDTESMSVESFHISHIEPILKTSKSFQGRLKASRLQQKGKALSHDTLYRFACYADCHIQTAYGLAQFRKLSDEKYVSKCFANKDGAVLLTHSWPKAVIVKWFPNDLKFFEKYLPEIFLSYEIRCPTLSCITPECSEHKLFLDALDEALLVANDSIASTEEWLSRAHYLADKKPVKTLLSSREGTIKLLTYFSN